MLDALSRQNFERLQGLVQGFDMMFLDEAQRVPEIGINLKLLVDNFPNLRLLVTGSSSLDLASQTKESLAGRAWNYTLYPIATIELASNYNHFELEQQLVAWLVYGSYTSLVFLTGDIERKEYLENVAL